MMNPNSTPGIAQRAVSPALLFVLSCLWIVVSLAGGRLAATFSLAMLYEFSREAVTALMLFMGFYLMAALGLPDLRPLSSVGLVRRPGIGREFGLGAAIGWGFALALMLPAALSGNVTLSFLTGSPAWQQLLISIAVLSAYSLAVQLVLSGLPVRLLVRSIGPGWTVAAVVFLGTSLILTSGSGRGAGIVFTVLEFCLTLYAFLRTRAIWLPLGLQLGFSISLQLLFGAPSHYTPITSGVVQNDTGGPVWLTGGFFGPEASAVAVAIAAATLIALFRVTRTYAWHYTYQPIVAAGYAMDVPPPAEHIQESKRVAAAAPLVQIGGLGTPAPSSAPLPEEL